MAVLLWGIMIITIALLVHITIWKVRLPKRQTRAIVCIFLTIAILGLLVLFRYNQYLSMVGIPVPKRLFEYLHIVIFIGALTIGYVLLYPGFQVDVPTLIILNTIAKAGLEGVAKEKLYEFMNDDRLIKTRIQDLLLDKMAYLNKEKYLLTPKGILQVKIILFFRKLQRLEQKGG